MNCPSCKAVVADDAAVCPKCDTVLDASLFSNAPPVRDDDPDDTAPPAPRKAPARPPSGSVKVPTGSRKLPTQGVSTGKRQEGEPGKPFKRPMPEAPARKVQEKRDMDWRKNVDKSQWTENEPPKPVAQAPQFQAVDPDDLISSVKSFMVDLSTADKIAFFGTVASILSCFLPWKDSITEGEVLGLMSLG